MVAKHYQNQIRQIKMESCFAHFEAMKKDLHTQSQITIARYYRDRLAMLKEKKEAAKAKSKKGKKGKKATKPDPQKTSTNSKPSTSRKVSQPAASINRQSTNNSAENSKEIKSIKQSASATMESFKEKEKSEVSKSKTSLKED